MNDNEEEVSMKSILAENFSGLEEGKLIKARVIKIGKESVFVDVGYKSDGIIPVKEFADESGKISIKEGDEVEVFLDRIENKEGTLVLSKYKADMLKNIDVLEKVYKDKDIIDGKILKEIKGGFILDVGNEVFLPNSQFSPEEVGGIDKAVGKVIPVKIIKFGRKRGEIIVSHKVALLDKNRRLRKELWDNLKEGDIKKGIVKSLTSYGAFIDIGGVTGLLHISDMSWGKVSHPAEILAIDSEVEVKVIKIDREKKRISLGLKQLLEDPWVKIEEKFPVDSVVNGKVVNIVDYGAFIKLEESIEGLLHISDMSWTSRIKNPSELLAIGDNIEVKILNIDKENRKILFGLKQLELDPFSGIEQKFPVGTKVTGAVTGYAGSKIFLEFEAGVEGILNKRDLSWTKRFALLKGIFRKGEKLEVMVLNIDKTNRKINVGIKQFAPDPWVSIMLEKFKVGNIIKCKVIRLTNFGVLVELEKDLEGFIHISEVSDEPIVKLEDIIKIGDEKQAKVIKLDSENRKINLSIKEYLKDLQDIELKKYSDTKEAKSTFGDILKKE